MPSRPSYEEFSDMPPGLRFFVLSDDFSKIYDTLQKTYGLTEEQKSLIGDRFLDAVFNDKTLSQALADMKAAIVPKTVPDDKWKDLATEILKAHAWPLRDLFSDELTQAVSELKTSTAGWPTFHVILKPLTYSGAASEIAATAGFSLMAPQARERMRELVVSKMKGVRVDSQVREVMMRQEDFGGLGMDATDGG